MYKDEALFTRVNQIIVPAKLRQSQEIYLEGDPFSALLFRKPYKGEIITLKDASGKEFRGRIVNLQKDCASVSIFEELTDPTELPFDMFLFQALPNKERMELIIQKGTELGVKVIVPFKSKHSISLEEREARHPKAHRWQHVALKATKQCRRASVPYVAPYCSFHKALEIARPLGLKLLLLEQERKKLSSILRSTPLPRSIALVVGPEGGWDEGEVRRAKEAGFATVGLGGKILRTETAAIAACAILQYEWGGS